MEEDINRMKYILEFGEKTGINYTLETDDKKALQNILNELDRLSKENEELKDKCMFEKIAKEEVEELLENSIPKSVIQDKIEELNENISKSQGEELLIFDSKLDALEGILGE